MDPTYEPGFREVFKDVSFEYEDRIKLQGENNVLDVVKSLGMSEDFLEQVRQKLNENKR